MYANFIFKSSGREIDEKIGRIYFAHSGLLASVLLRAYKSAELCLCQHDLDEKTTLFYPE